MIERETSYPNNNLRARRFQEWLCYHSLGVVIDGVAGPATRSAVRDFQLRRGIKEEDIFGVKTWGKLVEPMTNALRPAKPLPTDSIGRLTVYFAQQHSQQRPREIGGQNCGPWVRLYMAGNEGKDWPWCAGFAMVVVHQAAAQLGIKAPFPLTTFGCDTLADLARQGGIFETAVRPMPGWLFLVPGKPNHWSHVGIVIGTDGVSTMTTIEGNTSDNGSPEGFEVCRRTRTFAGKGFICI